MATKLLMDEWSTASWPTEEDLVAANRVYDLADGSAYEVSESRCGGKC